MTKLNIANPRNGQFDYEVETASADQVESLARTMRSAQVTWSDVGLQTRCDILKQWAEILQRDQSQIGEALCVDTGRRLVSHFEVQNILGFIQHWTSTAPELMAQGPASPSSMVPTIEVRHKLVPFPLVGVISPWNFPLTLSFIDTIPALLSGASVLLKPSEVTPRFVEPLVKTIEQVDLLKDVLKLVVGGANTGVAMINNVDVICFTGSVQTGRKVAVQAAQNFVPAFLELGGKDPAIVLASADIEKASTAILRSAVGMTGQACQSLERVYVHETIFDEFVETITTKAKDTNYNWPDIDQGQIGPLIFAAQADKIADQLEQARLSGAKFHCGGKVEAHDGGAWVAPTVVTRVDHSMQLMQEETFGPVIPVMPFKSTREAIELANDSQYGLSAAVFSADRAEAESTAEQLEVGAVSINDASLTAFVNDAEKNSFKTSGMGGSRMGASGLTRFLRKRAILFQSGEPTPISVFSEGQQN